MVKRSLALLVVLVGILAALPAMAAVYNAGSSTTSNYGYNADDIAVNQAVVVYWIAHGYANVYGGYPNSWNDVLGKNLPLNTSFRSPFTDDHIDLDDGSLDFPGDMAYSIAMTDVNVQVQTSSGVVTVPGPILGGQAKCGMNSACTKCAPCASCDVTIVGWDCWKCPNDQSCTCELAQWLLNKSFDTYRCRYSSNPASVDVWMASGLSPIPLNYREYAAFMDITFVSTSCEVKKSKVKCCTKCMACPNPTSKCGLQNGCVDGRCGYTS